MMFRYLKADEIECRVAQIKSDGSGLSLLLYKDARCDQRILDETVGEYNWQNSYSRDNANCVVSIWDNEKSQWISKENTGTESNTEAQKGLASDSFKRACFNWGIGRELYTAPFIWVTNDNCEIKKNKKDKWVCNDKFKVVDFTVDDGKIVDLSIINAKTGVVVYPTQKGGKKTNTNPKNNDKQLASRKDIDLIENLAEQTGVAIARLENKYGVKVLSALTKKQAEECIVGLRGMLGNESI